MGFQLPFPQLVSLSDFWTINSIPQCFLGRNFGIRRNAAHSRHLRPESLFGIYGRSKNCQRRPLKAAFKKTCLFFRSKVSELWFTAEIFSRRSTTFFFSKIWWNSFWMMIKTLLILWKTWGATRYHQLTSKKVMIPNTSRIQVVGSSTEPKPVPGPPLDGSQQRHP